MPSFSPSPYLHADLVGSGLHVVGSSQRVEGENPMRVRERSFDQAARKVLMANGALPRIIVLILGCPQLHGGFGHGLKSIAGFNHRPGTDPFPGNTVDRRLNSYIEIGA
jgi:hypothetical protein